ncbi:MAG: ABC transporter permease [Pseudomonadota bacterium]
MNTILIGYATIIRKEIIRYIRIWPQTTIAPLVTSTLYFLIFGRVIGSRIGSMNGINYIQFIVPGMIMLQVINISYNNTSSAILSGKYSKSIEELLISPLTNNAILLGYVTACLIRSIVIALLIAIVALFFTHLHVTHILLMLVTIIITTTLFATLGMINAFYAKKFDDINIIPMFILTPLTYMGGVFYSIKHLPPIWREISMLNPIMYTIDIFRYSMLGIADVNVYVAFSVLFIVTFIAYATCLYLFKKGSGIRN